MCPHNQNISCRKTRPVRRMPAFRGAAGSLFLIATLLIARRHNVPVRRRAWFLLAIWLYFLVRIVVDPYRSWGAGMAVYASSPLVREILFGLVTAGGVLWLLARYAKRGAVAAGKQAAHRR